MKRSIPSVTADGIQQIDQMFARAELGRSPHRRSAPLKVDSGRATADQAKGRKHVASSVAPLVLRVPEWRGHPWLMHGFSTRQGGVSTAYARESACGELNLGFTADDLRENVVRNRALFVRAVAGDRAVSARKEDAAPLSLLRQIHSGLIHRTDFTGKVGNADRPLRGDGWITDQPDILLGILTADCLPILVADVRLRVVAAFHAGWRGTLARIAERGVGRIRAEFGSRTEDLTAAIGPGIGACCYSVGEEVRMEFSSQFSYADALFQEVFDLDPIKQKYPMLFLTARAPGHSNLGPSLHLNLAEANRRQLQDAGLQPDKIHGIGLCTACNGEQFFSHRADQGFTGRMLSVIGIAE